MQVAQLRMDPERPLEKSSGLFVCGPTMSGQRWALRAIDSFEAVNPDSVGLWNPVPNATDKSVTFPTVRCSFCSATLFPYR